MSMIGNLVVLGNSINKAIDWKLGEVYEKEKFLRYKNNEQI